MELDTISRLAERAVAIGGALLALLIGRGLLGVGVALLVAGMLDLGLVSVLTLRNFARPARAAPCACSRAGAARRPATRAIRPHIVTI